MNNDSLELVNSEKYYYFSIISQLPIWIIFFLNLITQNNKDDTFSEPNNHNYYLPARIFEPCDSCYLIKEQIWRLATYSLIHIDFNHLFLNSLALLVPNLQCICSIAAPICREPWRCSALND